MSSRKRRIWLRHARIKQIVRAGLEDELQLFWDDYSKGQIRDAESSYKHLVRTTFLSISRPPIKFSGNQGVDSQGGSLINLQARNRQGPSFDLLQDNFDNLMLQAEEYRLWSEYRSYLASAASISAQAREILAPLRRVANPLHQEPQWTARAVQAARSIPYCRSSIFQYASSTYSVLDSARRFWLQPRLLKDWNSRSLDDHHVYGLLALDQACLTLQSIVGLLQQVDQWADDESISIDDDDFEDFRDEIARWEREESRYVLRRLAQAKDLLHLAQLAVAGADSKYIKALEIEVQQRSQTLAKMAPMAEKGLAFSQAKRGIDDLGTILIEILRENDGCSSKRVIKLLKDYEGAGVIQEVEEDGTVQWRSSSGKDKTTQFHSIEDRLSKYRANLNR